MRGSTVYVLQRFCVTEAVLHYLSINRVCFSLSLKVPRQFPYDNLYVERGGDPAHLNSEIANRKVASTYSEVTS